ncbi:MAG: hypothetical protein ACJ8GJ_07290 [Vitreoscilla sp.]
MLRALVLLFVLVNAALYFWLHSDPQVLQPDREPQRLNHQVSPDAVRVLPDLPASAPRSANSGASAGAALSSTDASAVDVAAGPAEAATAAAVGQGRQGR